MMYAHQLLLADDDYRSVARIASVGHLSGEANLAADSASRNKPDVIRDICRALGIQPKRREVPDAVEGILRAVVERARQLGVRPRRTTTPRTADPAVPGGPAFRFVFGDRLGKLLAHRHSDEQSRSSVHASPGGGGELLVEKVQTSRSHNAATHGDARRNHSSNPCGDAAVRRALASPLTRALDGPMAPRHETARNHHASLTPLQQAAGVHAGRAATALHDSPFFGQLEIEQRVELFRHFEELAISGAAPATVRKDGTAWKYWMAFAAHLGFDPIIQSADAASRQEEVTLLLSSFLLYVYPRMRGMRGRQWAKPGSAFQYVLAIIRVFKRWNVPMPRASQIQRRLAGLLRAYEAQYGHLAVAPRRREPLLWHMVCDIFNIPDGARLGRYTWADTDVLVRRTKCLLLVGWCTGHRLGDMLRNKRSSLAWVIDGVLHTDPTAAALLGMQSGDYALLSSGITKTDQFGEVHAPYPSVLMFDDEPLNAARALRALELELPCRGAARNVALLVLHKRREHGPRAEAEGEYGTRSARKASLRGV